MRIIPGVKARRTCTKSFAELTGIEYDEESLPFVVPDLEIPGMSATAWARPIKRASIGFPSSTLRVPVARR